MAAKPKTLTELLGRFDNDSVALGDHDVHEAVTKLHQEDREAGRPIARESIAEWAAFMFSPEYDWKDGGWGTYYGPLWGGRSDDGKESFVPDIHEFDASTFDYWGRRAREAKHPVLKMRYADLCWDFQRKIAGVSPEVQMAHIVIDSTVDAVARNLIKRRTSARKGLTRALSLTFAINDKSRVVAVRDAIVAFENVLAGDESANLWGFAFDAILEDKKVPKSAELEAKIVGDMEARLARFAALSDGKPVDPWGARRAALHLARHYRRHNKADDVRRVILSYGAAFVRLADDASGMQAAGWLRALHDHYLECGLSSDAESLLIKVREAAQRSNDEMAVHTQDIKIPKEEMDQFVDHMSEGTLSDSLNRVAIEFLAEKQSVVDLLKKVHESSPLMSLMSISITAEEGRPTANVGSLEHDLEGRIAYQLSQNMRFARIYLYFAIDRIREKFQPTADDIIGHLQQSPAFPEDGFGMLRTGLSFYLRNEHVGASHVLIPQIEATVRHLLKLCGGNLWKSHRSGGLMLKNLEDLLREEAVVKALSEDVVLNLRVLLTDQRGWNVRNGICHGLLTSESFGRGMTDRLLHALLMLALVRMKKG